MGKGRKVFLHNPTNKALKILKKYGVLPTLLKDIPKEENELAFEIIKEQRSNNLASPEIIRVAQSLTPQQLADFILN